MQVRLALVAALVAAGCTHDRAASPGGAPAASSGPAAAVSASSVGAASAGASAVVDASDAGAPGKEVRMSTKDRGGLAKEAFDRVAPRSKPGDDPSKSIFWSEALTPVFPAVWPPDGTVAAYVYARGRSMQLMDGERVAAPFARIVSTANAPDRIDALASTLTELGVQGVRPMQKDELATPSPATLEATVRALRPAQIQGPPPEDLRASYCQWKKLNGVIASRLLHERDPSPAAFLRWLGCST